MKIIPTFLPLLTLLFLIASCAANKSTDQNQENQKNSEALHNLASGLVFERDLAISNIKSKQGEPPASIDLAPFTQKVAEMLTKLSEETPWCKEITVLAKEGSAQEVQNKIAEIMDCVNSAYDKEAKNFDIDKAIKDITDLRISTIRTASLTDEQKIDLFVDIDDKADKAWQSFLDNSLKLNLKAFLALMPHSKVISSSKSPRFQLMLDTLAAISNFAVHTPPSYNGLIEKFNFLSGSEKAQAMYYFGLYSFIISGDKISTPLSDKENPLYVFDLYRKKMFPEGFADIGNTLRHEAEMKVQSDHIFADIPKSKTPVKLVFIDVGFDFEKVPEILMFSDKDMRIDTADNDTNVYLSQKGNPDLVDPKDGYDILSFSNLTHGTKTAASGLSLISQLNSQLLLHHDIVLGLVKTESTYGFKSDDIDLETLIKLKPDIVSRSMLSRTFQASNSYTASKLKEINFLYVMGAGNDAGFVESGNGNNDPELEGCFASFPVDSKPSDRIICVGALYKGVVFDELASYSNYGKLVDVYTYESIHKYCASGTSCATPSISAAAAMIKAKYPKLTAAQLKRVIVESAEQRIIFNDQHHGSLDLMKQEAGQQKSLSVPVFDPYTMMDAAYKKADSIVNFKFGKKP